jgi:alkylhydroperoxidase/carboxymuconolactone decarboxylase family protein YurZ
MEHQTIAKTLLEVYDPAMCCSTGVCGPDVDDALADFANDVKWLKSQGVEVIRYNLGQEPGKFKEQQAVLVRLKTDGSEVLPILAVNGQIVSEGGYPDRDRLMELLGHGVPQNEHLSENPDPSRNESMEQNQPASGTSAETTNGSPSETTNSTHSETSNGTRSETFNGPTSESSTGAPSAFTYDQRTDVLVAIGASIASGCAQSLRAGFNKGLELGISEEDMTRAMQTALNVRQVPMHHILEVANRLLGIPESGCTPGGGCC